MHHLTIVYCSSQPLTQVQNITLQKSLVEQNQDNFTPIMITFSKMFLPQNCSLFLEASNKSSKCYSPTIIYRSLKPRIHFKLFRWLCWILFKAFKIYSPQINNYQFENPHDDLSFTFLKDCPIKLDKPSLCKPSNTSYKLNSLCTYSLNVPPKVQ